MSSDRGNFAKDKKYGRYWSLEFMQWLLSIKEHKHVECREDEVEFQLKGIDAVLCFWDERRFSIEIKSDRHGPQRVYLETVTNGKPGAFVTSVADRWVHFFPGADVAFEFPLDALRAFVNSDACAKRLDERPYRSGWVVNTRLLMKNVPGAVEYKGVFAESKRYGEVLAHA